MKKINFLLGLMLSGFCIAQNEWNSINNSTSAMFRNGNVAIGTGATTLLPFAVRNSTGIGTKVSFGNNSTIFNYGTNASALEIVCPSLTEGSFLALNAGGLTNNSSLVIAQTQFGTQFVSAKQGTGTSKPMIFYTEPTSPAGVVERLKINTDGTIGIGIPPSYPAGYKLYVTDGILTEKVKVAIKTSTAWSDFVFEPDYKLVTLEETDAFIKKHKHLPNIPSAEEVVKDGIDVATMDAKLLRKIEELTLYMIEFNSKMGEQKQESEKLKKDVELLKKENEVLKLKTKSF